MLAHREWRRVPKEACEMSQRLRLTLLCGALVASLGLALPALANDDAGG
jgi:hypothetical protein